MDPAGERRPVGAVHAQHPQPRVARVLLAERVVGGVALPVEEVEAVVREVRLDRAVAVHVEHPPPAPSRARRHERFVRFADRLRELLDLPVRQVPRAGVGVRARVEDRLVREPEVLHARDERVLFEWCAQIRREERHLRVAVVQHERTAHQACVDALDQDVGAHEPERRAAVLGRDVGGRHPRSQRRGMRRGRQREQRQRDHETGPPPAHGRIKP